MTSPRFYRTQFGSYHELSDVLLPWCKRWVGSCLVSSIFFFQAFFPLLLIFKFYFGLSSLYTIYIRSYKSINYLPLHAPSRPKKFFSYHRQPGGGGKLWSFRVHVCVCWWSLFTSSVSLYFLSIHCHHQFITTLFFFPCRSSTGEKGELSLHPFIHLSSTL